MKKIKSLCNDERGSLEGSGLLFVGVIIFLFSLIVASRMASYEQERADEISSYLEIVASEQCCQEKNKKIFLKAFEHEHLTVRLSAIKGLSKFINQPDIRDLFGENLINIRSEKRMSQQVALSIMKVIEESKTQDLFQEELSTLVISSKVRVMSSEARRVLTGQALKTG